MNENEQKALFGVGMVLGAVFTVATLLKAAAMSQAAQADGSQ